MGVKKISMTPPDGQRLLGELVAERPARAHLFERLHLDYCCGGRLTLAEACERSGLQAGTVQAALMALDDLDAGSAAGSDGGEIADWRAADTETLCGHIVSAHHDFLRENLPRIHSLISTVVRVHGAQDATLRGLPQAFDALRGALEPHLDSEEAELFPAILAAEQGGPIVPEEILAGHEYEHEQVGTALEQLRSLCEDYDRRRARCNTHRALLDALEELELDIHQHVHEENNILFARARAATSSPTGGNGSVAVSKRPHESITRRAQTLPACCQGWAAQQGQRWARAKRGR